MIIKKYSVLNLPLIQLDNFNPTIMYEAIVDDKIKAIFQENKSYMQITDGLNVTTIPISNKSFEQITDKYNLFIYKKTRYYIPITGQVTILLDKYFDHYEAEIHFKEIEQLQSFENPKWIKELKK